MLPRIKKLALAVAADTATAVIDTENSHMNFKPDVHALAAQFQLNGEWLHAEPFGRGHINSFLL